MILSLLLSLILDYRIIGPGTISYAGPGVLESVEIRRAANRWGLQEVSGYEILIAPANCNLLGREGWLIVEGKIYPVIVVDCEADIHAGMMKDRGLLVDINKEYLAHKTGWAILK